MEKIPNPPAGPSRKPISYARDGLKRFAPQKYELTHLIRTKRFNLNRSLDLGTIVIEPKPAIQVLGLLMDSKLQWGSHIEKIRTKIIQ
jgi:hypothetical protein